MNLLLDVFFSFALKASERSKSCLASPSVFPVSVIRRFVPLSSSRLPSLPFEDEAGIIEKGKAHKSAVVFGFFKLNPCSRFTWRRREAKKGEEPLRGRNDGRRDEEEAEGRR